MTERSRGEWLGQQGPDEETSGEEDEFLRYWLPLLLDRLGGGGDGAQKRIAERMDRPSSTVSRYCTGKSLPDANRLRELCKYLRVPSGQQAQLADLLQRAHRARQARLRAAGSSGDRASLTVLFGLGGSFAVSCEGTGLLALGNARRQLGRRGRSRV